MAFSSQANADMLHMQTKSIPVQAASIITTVEQYYSSILRAWNIFREERSDSEK